MLSEYQKILELSVYNKASKRYNKFGVDLVRKNLFLEKTRTRKRGERCSDRERTQALFGNAGEFRITKRCRRGSRMITSTYVLE